MVERSGSAADPWRS